MLGKSKEADINEILRGPVMVAAMAILVIGATFALAENYIPKESDKPDKTAIFGTFMIDAIDEVVFYIKWGGYLAIIAGGIMVGVQLRIHPSFKDTHGSGE